MKHNELFENIKSISWLGYPSIDEKFDNYYVLMPLKSLHSISIDYLNMICENLKPYNIPNIEISAIDNAIVITGGCMELSLIHPLVLDFIEYLDNEGSKGSYDLSEFYKIKIENDKKFMANVDTNRHIKIKRTMDIRNGVEYDKDGKKISICNYELEDRYAKIKTISNYPKELAIMLLQNVTVYCDDLIKKLESEGGRYVKLENLYNIPYFSSKNISVDLIAEDTISTVTNKYPVNIIVYINNKFLIGREYNNKCEIDRETPCYNIIIDESVLN